MHPVIPIAIILFSLSALFVNTHLNLPIKQVQAIAIIYDILIALALITLVAIFVRN